MTLTSLLGTLAACLTTGSFLPQAYKTIRTKDTQSLSLLTFSMMFLGTIFWFTYGVVLNDFPLILANAISAFLSGIIFFLKIKDVLSKNAPKK